MASPPDNDRRESASPAPNDSSASPRHDPRPIVLMPVTGPPIPDMAGRVEESLRRHEAELAKAERLVAQARAGSAPEIVQRPVEPASPPAPGDYRIEFDWRGETAFCVEHDRRVRLACCYWGGPKGSVSHIDSMWDYADGRREDLTTDERALVLQRVIDEARKRESIRLEVEGD